MPSARYPVSSSFSAPGSPETTVDAGPLTAAMLSRSAQWVSRERTSVAGRGMEAMPPEPPEPPSSARARLRSATIVAAVSSDSAPAM